MRIIPTRTMRLGGQHVEQGRPADVPDEDAALALRHGWAVVADPEPKAPRRKASDEAAKD